MHTVRGWLILCCTTFCLTTPPATQAILCSCCEWNSCHIALYRTIVPATKEESFHFYSGKNQGGVKQFWKPYLFNNSSYPKSEYTYTYLGARIAHLSSTGDTPPSLRFRLISLQGCRILEGKSTPFSSLLATSCLDERWRSQCKWSASGCHACCIASSRPFVRTHVQPLVDEMTLDPRVCNFFSSAAAK